MPKMDKIFILSIFNTKFEIQEKKSECLPFFSEKKRVTPNVFSFQFSRNWKKSVIIVISVPNVQSCFLEIQST